MLADLTMIATLPVDQAALQKATAEDEEVRAQQPETPHPIPGTPKSPEQPVVPPDDPHRKDVNREPSIDPTLVAGGIHCESNNVVTAVG